MLLLKTKRTNCVSFEFVDPPHHMNTVCNSYPLKLTFGAYCSASHLGIVHIIFLIVDRCCEKARENTR